VNIWDFDSEVGHGLAAAALSLLRCLDLGLVCSVVRVLSISSSLVHLFCLFMNVVGAKKVFSPEIFSSLHVSEIGGRVAE